MYVAPISDEEERQNSSSDYASAMADWRDFEQTTNTMYGVDMSILSSEFKKEQKEYYLLSSRWAELSPESVLAEPAIVKRFDMATCTVDDARGISASDVEARFDFEVAGDEASGPISGFAGWFTTDFGSRTDSEGSKCPLVSHPAFLSTGPENGYTHWGQQVFHFPSSIPAMRGEITRIEGCVEMMRTKENSRLYNCRFVYKSSRRKKDEPKDGLILMAGQEVSCVYQIP